MYGRPSVDRRTSFLVGRKRASVGTTGRSSFASSSRRKSSTPGPDDMRRSTEPTTVPLVGRQSVLEEEKPKDRLPVGAFPKGLLERAEQDPDPSRIFPTRQSLSYDPRTSLAHIEKRKYSASKTPDVRKQSLPPEDRMSSMPLPPDGRRVSLRYADEGRRASQFTPAVGRRQSTNPPPEARRQSTLPSEARRQSTYASPDGRRQSTYAPPEGRKHSHVSMTGSDADDRRESMAHSQRTSDSEIYGNHRRRASSFVDTTGPERGTSASSIGLAEDVDLSFSSSSASARTVVDRQRYCFETRFEHFLIFVCYTMGFSNLYAFTNFSSFAPDRPSMVHYLVSYLCVGMPLLYMEMFIGQYSQRGVLLFGRIIPLAYGFGWAVLLLATYLMNDIVVSMGDALFYFIVSFAGTPWMDCKESYNTASTSCLGAELMHECLNSKSIIPKKCFSTGMEFSATLFLNRYVVQADINWEVALGGLRPGRVVCSLLSWILITLTTLIGFNKYKRILQISCVLIVAFLSVLLFMVMSTRSELIVASLGQMFLIRKGSLTSIGAWTAAFYNAIGQLCICQGGHVLFGSFMRQKTEGDLQAIVFVITTLIANLFGGLLVQTIAAVLQQHIGVALPPDMPEGVRGLYVTVPQALGVMQVPQLLSILYFSLIFLAIYQNQVIQLDVIVESIIDAVPKVMVYRKYMVSMFGVAGFILGVPYATGIGNQLKEDLGSSRMPYVFLVLVIVEALCVLWLYGTQKFCDDIHFLIGAQPTLFWKICWRITPAVAIMMLVHTGHEFSGTPFRLSVKIVGFIYAVLTISPLIVGAIYKCLKYLQYHNLVGVLKSENEWGHPDPHERLMRHIYNPRHETRSRRRDPTCKHRCLKDSSFLKELTFGEKMAATNLDLMVEVEDKKQPSKVDTPPNQEPDVDPESPPPEDNQTAV